jgi:hypothetical protein
MITMYLHCLAGDRLRDWLCWLTWAEFCYNSAFQASLRTSLVMVVYGRPPPSVRTYTPWDVKLWMVHQQMMDRDEFLREICDA